MELTPGQKVTLCNYNEAKNELYRYPPGFADPMMRSLFGKEITISNIINNDLFQIEEDSGHWNYHKDWIISENVIHISSKMRRMM